MSRDANTLKAECEKTVQHLKKDCTHMRSGRASTALLEGLHVDYYGTSVPLMQLGMVNAPEPRLLTVQIYDRGAVDAVEKAIQSSELGLNPSRDGNLLRIVIPSLTEERRKDLIKKLHKMGEEAKVAIRNHRRDQIDFLKKQEKDKAISEDDLRKASEDVQKVTDKYTSEIDHVLAAKEKEMMEV